MAGISDAKPTVIWRNQAVDTLAEVVLVTEWIGRDIDVGWRPILGTPTAQCVDIDAQAAATRPLRHPQQGYVAELVREVTSADVAVHAAEPHLLDYLVARCVRLWRPKRRAERAAPFIDRQSLIGGIDEAAQIRV